MLPPPPGVLAECDFSSLGVIYGLQAPPFNRSTGHSRTWNLDGVVHLDCRFEAR